MGAEHLIETLRGKRPSVLVVGDILLDRRWEGTAERLCREGPVPVLDVDRTLDAPGGAANTAMNLAALGARVRLVGVAGDDEPGDALVARLEEAGVETESIVRLPGRTTSVKARLVADGQLLLRSDFCRPAEDDESREACERALAAFGDADAVVLCDYGLGALVALDRPAARERARALVVDARHPGGWASLHADVVTPNASEAAELLSSPVPRVDRITWAAEHAEEISRATGARHTLVTLDRDGTILLSADQTGHPSHTTRARPAPEQNAVGAGDTFVAGLVLGLAAGLAIDEAADVGQAAADVVVESPGTSICTSERLLAELEGTPRPTGAGNWGAGHPSTGTTAGEERALKRPTAVRTWEETRRAVEEAREAGFAVVLTNGVFDELHRGHTAFLDEAARHGGLLVVGVNSDESVRRLRGASPVVGEEDRAAVVAALGSVDCAVVFDSETAVPLIRELRPDVYVKGGDYLPGMLAEQSAVREVGGRLELLGYVERKTAPSQRGRHAVSNADRGELS
ncbi:PfkB family carbohydrate kinase [Sinomonas terrae]|uniref:PfkB family carbohydrate kinase n=1 Tax=Sinomonas terrae TaxID=2908838 RepID=A0ABS9U4W1_9MICC|nr:PfkB family carbohydrate kinase [Sinomonas terrae]MCH6471695.1 PfkB family carbohydrate kinase [Sinomonas terrae]